jgi:PadR family transcriptional regulator
MIEKNEKAEKTKETKKNEKLIKKKKSIKKIGKKSEQWNVDCTMKVNNFDKSLLSSLMKGFLKIIILWIITKERIHGYEIIKKMKEKVENESGDFELKGPGPNKIYPILHELEDKGLIIGDWESQGKRKIKFYEATEKGMNTIEIIRKKPHKDVPPILLEFWKDVMIH